MTKQILSKRIILCYITILATPYRNGGFIVNLVQPQLLLLYPQLAKAKGLSSDTDIVTLLTPAEIDNAIKETNTTMQSWYDTIVEELEKEAATEDDEVTDDEDKEEDEEKEDVLEPRPVRPADAEAKFDPNATVETFTKKFFDEGYDYGHKDSEFITKALADLKSDLEKNYRNYDYYLNKNYESAWLVYWHALFPTALLYPTLYWKLNTTAILKESRALPR